LRATERAEQHVTASWDIIQPWIPEDNTQFGLSNEDAWFDDDTGPSTAETKVRIEPVMQKGKRSMVSVRRIELS